MCIATSYLSINSKMVRPTTNYLDNGILHHKENEQKTTTTGDSPRRHVKKPEQKYVLGDSVYVMYKDR